MADFFDYLKWRGDLIFSKAKYNIVDIAIISQLAILDLESSIPNQGFGAIKDISEKYFSTTTKISRLGLIIPMDHFDLLKELAKTRRFKNLEISDYLSIIDENKEEQISAFTLKIRNNFRVITFSGTDDTIIGWKENFHMMYKSPIPAQLSAVKYINEIMSKYPGKFILCGHSKGGNMAIYGGIHCDRCYHERIMKIYNFDGPGLNTETTNKDNFISIVNKIITILPQSSIIGRLFEHKEKCRIIKSNEVALYQHDVFSWEVLGNDFVYEKELTKESNVVDKKIRLVLEAMTDFEKEQFVEGIYRIVLKTNAKSLIDLSNRKKAILGAYIKTPKKERIYVRGPIMKLLKDRVVLSFIRKSFREYSKQKNRDV